MSSPEVSPREASLPGVASERGDVQRNAAGLRALLDTVFGYVVWAAHFLVVYIATAVSCQLRLGAAVARTGTTFLTVLAMVTLVAGATVVLHAVRRYRQQRDVPDRHFRLTVTIGNDSLATVGITWQLLAIALVPLCR